MLEEIGAITGVAGNFVAKIDVGSFLKEFNFSLGRDLVDHRLKLVVLERRIIHAYQVAINPKHRRIIGGEVQVRGFFLGHQFKESVDASHAVPRLEQLN